MLFSTAIKPPTVHNITQYCLTPQMWAIHVEPEE